MTHTPLSNCCKAPVRLHVLTNEYMKYHSDICTSCGFPCTLAEPTPTSVKGRELWEDKTVNEAMENIRNNSDIINDSLWYANPKIIEEMIYYVLHSELERKAKEVEGLKDEYPLDGKMIDTVTYAKNWANPLAHKVIESALTIIREG